MLVVNKLDLLQNKSKPRIPEPVSRIDYVYASAKYGEGIDRLKKLIREMDEAGRVIGSVGRGPKLLMSAGVLSGRRIVAAPEMRDDLLAAGVDSPDQPILRDDNLLSCQGTEDCCRDHPPSARDRGRIRT